MKNLEIKFVAYTQVDGYQLDKYETLSEELTETLVKAFDDEQLEDGTQYFKLKDTVCIIDVDIENEEITVIDTV